MGAQAAFLQPINNPPTSVSQAPAVPPPGLLERAIANPRRRRTPARQRAAFLEQLALCGSVMEAALRAGVNRGTLYRWKSKDPDFAGRWAEAIRRRAERRELLLLRAGLAGRSPEKSQSATPVATPSMPEMCSDDLGLAAAA